MKRNSYRLIAMVLAVMTAFCTVVLCFAYDTEIAGDDLAFGGNTETTVSANKADYYSRIADMNEDWMLNSADARRILRLVAKIDWAKDPYWLPKGVIFGDIDENGVLNSSDARWALRVSARMNTVPEVIAAEATRPTRVPTTAAKPSETTPEATKPAATTVPVVTTNPYEVISPLCDEFAVTVTSASGVKYTMATDGWNCYIASDDVLSGLIVYVDGEGNTYILNGKDKEYAQFKLDFINAIGLNIKDIRKFIASFAVPEFGVFEDCKVTTEYIDYIPFKVAEHDGVKFYFYADGSMLKISAKDYKGTACDFQMTDLTYDAMEYLSVLASYEDIGSNMFIIKNGISLIF